MELDISSLKPNPQSLNILLDTISFIEDDSKKDKEVVLEAPLETWNELLKNKVKVYADTPVKKDPEEMGKALLERVKSKINSVENEGTITSKSFLNGLERRQKER